MLDHAAELPFGSHSSSVDREWEFRGSTALHAASQLSQGAQVSKFSFGKSFSKPFPISQFLQLPVLISVVNTGIC